MKNTSALLRILTIVITLAALLGTANAQTLGGLLPSGGLTAGFSFTKDKAGTVAELYTEANYIANGRNQFTQIGNLLGVPLGERGAVLVVTSVVATPGVNLNKDGTLRKNPSKAGIDGKYTDTNVQRLSKKDLEKRVADLQAQVNDLKAGRANTSSDQPYTVSSTTDGILIIYYLDNPNVKNVLKTTPIVEDFSAMKNHNNFGPVVLDSKDAWHDIAKAIQFHWFYLPEEIPSTANENYWATSLMVGLALTGNVQPAPGMLAHFVPTAVEKSKIYQYCKGLPSPELAKGNKGGNQDDVNTRIEQSTGVQTATNEKPAQQADVPFDVIVSLPDSKGERVLAFAAKGADIEVIYTVGAPETFYGDLVNGKPQETRELHMKAVNGSITGDLTAFDDFKTLSISVQFTDSVTGKTRTEKVAVPERKKGENK
jgi:hypothetical protein